MSSKDFENLVKAGMIKPERANQAECIGLLQSGKARLKKMRNMNF